MHEILGLARLSTGGAHVRRFSSSMERVAEGLDVDSMAPLVHSQSGVVSRRQIVGELGGRDHDIARMIRRRELRAVHPGVYVVHTGPLSWEQRAWAAVLAVWPAALTHESALPASLRQEAAAIQVAVDVRRNVSRPAGVGLHRTAHLDDRVDWHRSPPRVRLPEAVLDVVLSRSGPTHQFRVLADVCQTRHTTSAQIAVALAGRARVAERRQLVEMLRDLSTGASSILEREYLALERRHGLPSANRQRREMLAGRSIYRDVPYEDYGIVVELDGRAFHDNTTARDRDFERDLDTQVGSEATTIRLTFGQVFDRGCPTIAKIGLLLTRRGWPGRVLRCPRCG